MYSFSGRIRYSEIGEDGRLSLMGMMNYLQDCSTFQSEDGGGGVAWLAEHDRAWLLTAWKIRILRLPSLGETVTTLTKPYLFEGILGYRLFEIRGADNELLVHANSVWCYVQPSRQRPVRITEADMAPYLPIDPQEEVMTNRKLRAPAGMVPMEPFAVRREHLDTNHHVNNGQYVRMAMEYLPEHFHIDSLQVEYRNQARLHDVIVPSVCLEGNTLYVSLGDGNGKVYAVAAFTQENGGKS